MSTSHPDQQNFEESSPDSLQDLYNEVLVHHVKHPVGTLAITMANAEAISRNESCGDEVSVRLLIENDKVMEAELQAKGCMICRASASLCAQAIQGESVDEVKALIADVRQLVSGNELDTTIDWSTIEPDERNAYQVLTALEAFPTRQPCALMAWETVARALEQDAGSVSPNIA